MITLYVPGLDEEPGPESLPAALSAAQEADRLVEHTALLLEQSQQFLATAGSQVRTELGEFFAAQGLHPVGASGVFIDDLGFTAHRIRQNLKGHHA
jgi:hypothetical protein